MLEHQADAKPDHRCKRPGVRQCIRHMLYRLPVIRGMACQIQDLDKKYRELALQYEKLCEHCQKLQEKDRGLDFRIDDAYHEIFLNRKEIRQRYYQLLPRDRYPEALKEWYFSETGKKLDLAHPKTFNEKIQWIKLYGLDEINTELADKYKVRAYIAQKLGETYLIPLLGVWDTFDEIDFKRLPDRFVLKANHGSGMNMIVRDKASFDRQAAERQFRRWMCTDYAFYTGFELHYSAIQRKIIAEEYLEEPGGGGLREYKVYCFSGVPEVIGYYEDVPNGRSAAFYDAEWNRLSMRLYGYITAGKIEKPSQLEEILEMSRKVSQEFLFLRMDWYLMDDGQIKFGEITFTPGSGIVKRDPEWEEWLGERLCLQNNRGI